MRASHVCAAVEVGEDAGAPLTLSLCLSLSLSLSGTVLETSRAERLYRQLLPINSLKRVDWKLSRSTTIHAILQIDKRHGAFCDTVPVAFRCRDCGAPQTRAFRGGI